MQHPYFFKKIGNVSDKFMTAAKDYFNSPTFKLETASDFSPDVINTCTLTPLLKKMLLENELGPFFKKEGHVATNVAVMSPMSYLKEHGDLSSQYKIDLDQDKFSKIIKLQIPIITNDKVGMMWAPTAMNTRVVSFDLGGIYIIDNIRTHSAVNLSNEYRYYVTTRYHLDSLIDSSIIE
jgi:hypothetical protein